MKIPLAEPNLTGKEHEYTAEAIASGWVGPEGPFVERFEEMVAKAAGRKWAVATTTGTHALHVSAYVLCFGAEKQVHTAERDAYPAMRHVLILMNALAATMEGGRNHDISNYAPDEDWPVVCDRAPALGELPTDATLECYSFAANKTVTCGQGGAIVGDDRILERRIREAISHRTGLFNYRMANINAAIGCAQMERLDEFRERKKEIWNRYRDAGLPMIDRGPSRWMSTVHTCGEYWRWSELMAHSVFEYRAEDTWGISLPCSTSLTEEDQDTVIRAVKEADKINTRPGGFNFVPSRKAL